MFGATMASLSTQLAIRLDTDVIDETGIAGMFDMHLEAAKNPKPLIRGIHEICEYRGIHVDRQGRCL
jgi:uncharacterized protein (TIGR03435 family)